MEQSYYSLLRGKSKTRCRVALARARPLGWKRAPCSVTSTTLQLHPCSADSDQTGSYSPLTCEWFTHSPVTARARLTDNPCGEFLRWSVKLLWKPLLPRLANRGP